MTEPVGERRTRSERVLRSLLPRARRGPVVPVDITAHHLRGEPVSWSEATSGRYEPFTVGQAWGAPWDTTWFRIRGQVPDHWAGSAAVLVVRLASGGGTGFTAEGMVWRDGQPVQGLSPNHDEVVIAEPAEGGEAFEIYVEAAANPRVQSGPDPLPMHLADFAGPPTQTLVACHLAVANREVEALWEDWSVLQELYANSDPELARSQQILRALERAGRLLDWDDPVSTAGLARAELVPALGKRAAASAHRYAAVGNAHIDTAWLWPLRETRRKVARTFSTAVSLMEEYPDYRFAASQAQQFAWIRDDYPQLYERVRKKVADGQFEPIGSMWVEADCNIPSGESLVRQIVHGKRFFADEFGVETESLWLPDVFGYPANLPQILRLAGVRWFLTQKLSWNQWNHFPHHTFWWEGIDGTRILSHFPPADTYVGDMSVAQLLHGARNFAQKALTDRSMYLFGWGDGGGGPTRHMLERAARTADLEGLPRVELMTSRQAFEAIEEEVPLEELPVWVGELYLEMHRGTYTTQGAVKRANRRLESALREAELWSAAAAALGHPYPGPDLDAAWKTLLLHQFHDIIPGSSIHWVYEDTAADYARLETTTDRLIDAAGRRLLAASAGSEAEGILVLNPLSWPRREVIFHNDTTVEVEAPACGWAWQVPSSGAAQLTPVQVGEHWMDNGVIRAEWDDRGLITSLRHLETGREALVAGRPANLLQVHPDRPNQYDAWDIDIESYLQVEELDEAEQVEVFDRGPLMAEVHVRRAYGRSTIDQVLRLRAGSPYLEIDSVVDWQERHRLLKAAFPVAVHSARATYEVQFGHLERPTHTNTTWDAARYEVCAHTWADLSESGFGVALLNDCKYGHDIRGNVMRLTLLRSPTWPDPEADRGRHVFTYAVMPHRDGPVAGGVVQAAHGLNHPLRVVRPEPSESPADPSAVGPGDARQSLVEVDDALAVVSAVKLADDGRGIMVRLYEAGGGYRTVRVRCRPPGGPTSGAVSRTDLLERPAEPAPVVEDGAAVVDLHPFEIVTLRFE